MKTFIKEDLWFKFFAQLCLKNTIIFLNFFKYFLLKKNLKWLILFKFIHNIFEYKMLFNYFSVYISKNNINLQKKYIQKGYKSKKLGIYIRDFLKDNIDDNININNNCYLIMRFKRKNLFLTLLNVNGNVLCKTNIGSCGFKKKVKFTGYAIKRTSKKFYKKIISSFINVIYNIRKDSIKNRDKIKDLILLKKNVKLNQNVKVKKIKRIKIKKLKKKQNLKTNFYAQKNSVKDLKKLIRTNLLKQKVLIKLENYRNYFPNFINTLKNSLKIVLRIKSSLKFWGFRFIMYGLIKRFYWFNGIEIRLPIAHSKGLRLKKKRRI